MFEFGGAAGTLSSLGKDGLRTQVELAKELNLDQPEIAWHTVHDRIAEVGCFLGLVTGICGKIAFDVKLMMQTEVEEVFEPFHEGRGSSSTMPQKRNPISSVYITALTGVVRQQVAALLNAMEQDHERATGQWEIEWIVLPEIFVLTAGCLAQTKFLVAGLQVDEKRMRANLDITKGLIVSEAVMMGLGPHLGRQYAHDLVYDICRQVVATGRPLADLLAENEEIAKHMSKAELAKLCDPANYLGQAGEMVDRVLVAARQAARSARRRSATMRGRAARKALTPHAAMRFSSHSNVAAYPMNVSGEFTVKAPREVVFETLRDPSASSRFVDGVQRPEGDRPDPLRGGVRDQGRLHEIPLQRDRRGHAHGGAGRDRGQDRGHAARRRRPADREIDHHARPKPATRPRSSIRSSPRSPASSAASASRCCAPRPRTWKRYSPAGCAPHSRHGRRLEDPDDPIRARRTEVARRRDQAARSGRPDGASDRRRHRTDADDEGRRVPAGQARQPAQDRERSIRASRRAATGFASAR